MFEFPKSQVHDFFANSRTSLKNGVGGDCQPSVLLDGEVALRRKWREKLAATGWSNDFESKRACLTLEKSLTGTDLHEALRLHAAPRMQLRELLQPLLCAWVQAQRICGALCLESTACRQYSKGRRYSQTPPVE